MSMINLSLKHGTTIDEARKHLEKTVDQVRATFGALIHRTDWTPDHNGVKIAGSGFEIDMRIDAESVYVTGDIPFLGRLLGSPVVGKLKGIVENTFQKKLSEKPKGT